MKPASIIIVAPMKRGDPTEHTFIWAMKAKEMALELGYNVITIEKDQTTYQNVTDTIKRYKPKLFVAFSHGCPNSLIGQSECMVTRKFSIDELISMADNPEKKEVVLRMINPLGAISCAVMDHEICSPLCENPTNIGELKGSLVFAISCFSAKQLGLCSVKYGVQSYVGEDDLIMFPVDRLGSQNIFGDVQLEYYKNLLLGKTVSEAEQEMIKLEDSFIKRYKKVKYIALTLLWNKKYRRILGDKNARIFE